MYICSIHAVQANGSDVKGSGKGALALAKCIDTPGPNGNINHNKLQPGTIPYHTIVCHTTSLAIHVMRKCISVVQLGW